jgi:hypothetical protein
VHVLLKRSKKFEIMHGAEEQGGAGSGRARQESIPSFPEGRRVRPPMLQERRASRQAALLQPGEGREVSKREQVRRAQPTACSAPLASESIAATARGFEPRALPADTGQQPYSVLNGRCGRAGPASTARPHTCRESFWPPRCHGGQTASSWPCSPLATPTHGAV